MRALQALAMCPNFYVDTC